MDVVKDWNSKVIFFFFVGKARTLKNSKLISQRFFLVFCPTKNLAAKFWTKHFDLNSANH